MIKDHISTSVAISIEDFDDPPFYGKGGRVKAYQVFGKELDNLLPKLNADLVFDTIRRKD